MNNKIAIKSAAICCPDPSLLSDFAIQSVAVDNSLLPSGIRRRTSLTTRMAVTAASHACQQASVDVKSLPSVFASVGGEIQITDALCRTMLDPDALLSPTQFHNSVHNTTAGYWSIIQGCQAPTTAIASADDTFAMGLLEAWSHLQQFPGAILLVCYDEVWPQYLAPPIGKIALACAMILSNDSNFIPKNSISAPAIASGKAGINQDLKSLIEEAPAAVAIPLLQAFQDQECDCDVPLNPAGRCWYTRYTNI